MFLVIFISIESVRVIITATVIVITIAFISGYFDIPKQRRHVHVYQPVAALLPGEDVIKLLVFFTNHPAE
jgi:hypothetical protein